MWIQGTFRERACPGHAIEEVGETGDMVKHCEVITEGMEDGIMKIECITPNSVNNTISFCIGSLFSVELDGEVIAEATANGMMITPPNPGGSVVLICDFNEQQLQVSYQIGGLDGVTVVAWFADLIE